MQFFLLSKNICKKGIRIEYIVFICYDSEPDTFCNTGLTSVTLHEGLTKIEDWAFHDCLKLKKIRIPKSVTYIGENGAEEVVPGGFTIEGYTGSAAERYVKNVHRFENIYHVFFTDVKFVSIGGQTAAVTNISKTKISALKTRKAADPGTHHNLRR